MGAEAGEDSGAAVIRDVETWIVTLPRDVPYLGPLGAGEHVNARGYFVREGNRTIYPTVDRSVLVRITSSDGHLGWGETYGIVAPRAVTEIIADVIAPLLIGQAVSDIASTWQRHYDLMRVRGHWSGFFTDALAAVDIALWDLAGKRAGKRVVELLGEVRRERIPAYGSGLPRATLPERVALARDLVDRGMRGVKFAAAVAHQGVVDEMRALREALGDAVEIMVDLHWKYSPTDAITLIRALEPYRPYFVEAPCAPEDADGEADVAANVTVPIAGGEEWSTVYQARPRIERRCVSVIQPEVAHTGISQFVDIGRIAATHGVSVIPHATVGIGIFHAASLHAAASLARVPFHEYQHSIFDTNLRLLDTTMRCAGGEFHLPRGPGLGVELKDALWEFAQRA